jgi:hypothetical protein
VTGVESYAASRRLSPLLMYVPRAVSVRQRQPYSLVLGKQLFSAPDDPKPLLSEAPSEMQLNINQPFSFLARPTKYARYPETRRTRGGPESRSGRLHLEGARICYPLSYPFLQLVYRNRSEEVTLLSRAGGSCARASPEKMGSQLSPGIRAVFWSQRNRCRIL